MQNVSRRCGRDGEAFSNAFSMPAAPSPSTNHLHQSERANTLSDVLFSWKVGAGNLQVQLTKSTIHAS